MFLYKSSKSLIQSMRRVLTRIFVFSTCLWGFHAQAASDFYEAFNFKKCLHYQFDNEPHGIALSTESTEYMTAYNRANEHPNSLYKIKSWQELEQLPVSKVNKLVSVYSAGVKGRNKSYINQFGACFGNTSVGVTCLPNQDFPLSGASYRVIASKGELKTFACNKGCEMAPDFIYDMGYENMESERNIEHEAAIKKFSKACGINSK
jgi:hypothetical protein